MKSANQGFRQPFLTAVLDSVPKRSVARRAIGDFVKKAIPKATKVSSAKKLR